MEESNISDPEQGAPVTSTPAGSVGFPSQKQPKKANSKKLIFIIAFIVILVILGAGWFVLSDSQEEIEPAPTPFVESVNTTIDEFDEPEEVSSEPVDRESVTIEILNGTGVAKAASFLQGKLRTLGYTDIETGNAANEDNTATKVTFSSSLADEIVDEITKELEDVYKDVEVKTSSLETGVQIVTGLRIGQTAKPSATPTAEPEETATPTPTATP